jgi:transposase
MAKKRPKGRPPKPDKVPRAPVVVVVRARPHWEALLERVQAQLQRERGKLIDRSDVMAEAFDRFVKELGFEPVDRFFLPEPPKPAGRPKRRKEQDR